MLDFLESFFMAAYIIIAEVVTRIYSLVSPKFRFLPTNQPYWLPPKKGTILITGATAGLGKESAKYLAKLGYHVLITARNEDKGKKVLEEIKSFSGNQNVELHLVDFASLSSVRSFAQKMRDRKIPIHVLMNNAGALNEPVSVTKDHLESNFQVNHAAPMLLTVLLLDNLKMASPPARIVTVASVGSYFGPIDVKDLSWKKSSLPLHPLRNYFKAKLCNVMFASELQRKLNKEGRPDIISVSLHPGMIASSFYEEIPSFLKAIVRSFFTDSFFGARTQIYLTLAAPEELKKGGFYVNCEPYTPAPQAKDASLQKKLWVETSKLIGLNS